MKPAAPLTSACRNDPCWTLAAATGITAVLLGLGWWPFDL